MILTETNVKALEAKAKRYTVWEPSKSAARLGIRVATTARKVFVCDFIADGRRRRMTIGEYGITPPCFTVKGARQRAEEIANDAKAGADALAKRREAQAARVEERDRERPTLSHLWKLYEGGYLRNPAPRSRVDRQPLAQSTIKRYTQYWRSTIEPLAGHLRIEEITHKVAERIHDDIGRQSHYSANRCVAVLQGMLRFAAEIEMIPRGLNPFRGLTLFKEHKKQRFLNEAEFAAVAAALDKIEAEKDESPSAILALRILMLTGARKGEVLNMKWNDLDLDRAVWNLAASKTGGRAIRLSAPAVKLLKAAKLQRPQGNPFVMYGKRRGTHHADLYYPWKKVKELSTCDLEGVRIHDLRHSYASAGLAAGLPLEVVQALLGHSKIATTARYAHLAADRLAEATETIGAGIAAAMDNGQASTGGD